MDAEINPVEWLKLTKEAGVAIAFLVVICWFLRNIVIWFGQQIIIPVRDRLLSRLERFFDKSEETMDTLLVNVNQVSDQLKLQNSALLRIEQQGCGGNAPTRKPDAQIRPVG